MLGTCVRFTVGFALPPSRTFPHMAKEAPNRYCPDSASAHAHIKIACSLMKFAYRVCGRAPSSLHEMTACERSIEIQQKSINRIIIGLDITVLDKIPKAVNLLHCSDYFCFRAFARGAHFFKVHPYALGRIILKPVLRARLTSSIYGLTEGIDLLEPKLPTILPPA